MGVRTYSEQVTEDAYDEESESCDEISICSCDGKTSSDEYDEYESNRETWDNDGKTSKRKLSLTSFSTTDSCPESSYGKKENKRKTKRRKDHTK